MKVRVVVPVYNIMENIFKLYNKPIFFRCSFSEWLSKTKLFVLSLVAFISIQPYFFWGKGIIVCGILLFLFLIQFLQEVYGAYTKISGRCFALMGTYLLFYIYRYILHASSIKGVILSILTNLYPVFVLVLCTNKEKRNFLNIFTSFISIVLFFSLVEYFLVVFNIVNIMPSKITFPENDYYDYFKNYGLFIVVADSRVLSIPRFQSVFTEPGHLGMMGALLLYANAYNLKDKRIVVILVATIMSLSLTAYVLLVAGLFLFLYSKSKKKALALIVIIFFLISLGFISLSYYYAHPDSLFSKSIIARLLPDKKRGIKGNNRTTSQFKKAYANQMQELGFDALFGYGENAIFEQLSQNGGNSSGTVFLFMYGIVGGVLLSIFYISICYARRSGVIIGMLCLYFLSFLQRPYAVWFSQISLMISASVVFYNNYHKKQQICINFKEEKIKC